MITLQPQFFLSLLQSHPVLLLSTRLARRNNLAPVVWYAPVSLTPPLLGITLKPSSMSYQYLRESGDFVVAVCHGDMAHDVHFCGVNSDRWMEKMRYLALPTQWGCAAGPLILPSALANLECRVREIHRHGDCPWIVGEVISAIVDPYYYEKSGWKPGTPLLHYGGGNQYRVDNQTLDMSRIRPGNVESMNY